MFYSMVLGKVTYFNLCDFKETLGKKEVFLLYVNAQLFLPGKTTLKIIAMRNYYFLTIMRKGGFGVILAHLSQTERGTLMKNTKRRMQFISQRKIFITFGIKKHSGCKPLM